MLVIVKCRHATTFFLQFVFALNKKKRTDKIQFFVHEGHGFHIDMFTGNTNGGDKHLDAQGGGTF